MKKISFLTIIFVAMINTSLPADELGVGLGYVSMLPIASLYSNIVTPDVPNGLDVETPIENTALYQPGSTFSLSFKSSSTPGIIFFDIGFTGIPKVGQNYIPPFGAIGYINLDIAYRATMGDSLAFNIGIGLYGRYGSAKGEITEQLITHGEIGVRIPIGLAYRPDKIFEVMVTVAPYVGIATESFGSKSTFTTFPAGLFLPQIMFRFNFES